MPDNFVDMNATQDGGKRKKRTTKKPAAPKKGGDALSEQLTGLAVPFAFLLAKQGLEAMKSKPKSTTPKKKISPRRRASLAGGDAEAAPSALSGGKKSKTGGNCSTCNRASMIGGAAHSLRNLEKLRKNIDNFLSKY